MRIAIDVSPLESGNYLQHRVRGTGFYLKNLKETLVRNFPSNDYVFFKRGDKLSDSDVIHIPYFEPFFITLPFSNLSKTVITVHDLTPLVFRDKFPSGIKGRVKWNIQKRLLKNSGRIITDSESSKKDIMKYTGIDGEKIDVVYLAAAQYFKKNKNKSDSEKTIKKLNLPEEFLLYVGDVTWNKNLPGLIEAVGRTGYTLVIVGKAFVDKEYDKENPWNQDLLKAQELASANTKIVPVGFVEDEDLVNLYNGAAAFIMPSFYEGFGLPILEAMQSGCPVITSKSGSIEEVAGEAPYYVNPESIESIEKGINKVMGDNNLRSDLSNKGILQAKKFSWEKTAEETIKVYKKVANSD